MSDDVKDLLDRLAATAPEPSRDVLAEVHQKVAHQGMPANRRRLAPLLVAVATVVALLVAVGLVALSRRGGPATPPAITPSPIEEAGALTAGTAFSRLFFSPDYRDIDRYSDDVADGSTGSWRADVVGKRAELKHLLTQLRSVARGEVLASAVRDVTPTSATVLVAVDQDVRNSTTHGREVTNHYRVGVELRHVDGRWVVSNVEPIFGGRYGPGCPDPSASRERSDLLEQTCAAVGRLFSYDYRTLDADLAARQTLATAPLRNEVGQQFTPGARHSAAAGHVTVEAGCSTAAVERQDATTAVLLVFEYQTVSNDVLKKPRFDLNRLQVSMQRVGDRWLVAEIRAL